MKIRLRLTLQFSLIVASILLLFSVGIYYFSSTFRQKEFLGRLEMKALSDAKMLLDVKEIDMQMLKIIDANTQTNLYSLNVQILNSKNKIVYNTKDKENLIEDKIIKKLDHKNKITFSIDNYEGLGINYNSGTEKFKIFVIAYDKVGMQQLGHLKLILLSGLIMAIFVIWFSGYSFAGRALLPISKVVNQAEKITASNLNLRIDSGNTHDEIAQLANTFNKMLERLEQAFQMQRNFVSNASHELRTPLTSITGQIDVALISKRTTDEYEKILRSLLDDIKGLNALSNGLLELAQSNIDFSKLKFTLLRVDEILLETQAEIKRLHPEYVINIDYYEMIEDEPILTIFGNANLLHASFRNLVDNGCKFSDDHRIEIKISTSNSNVVITFKDFGIGIPQDEINKVFEPFYRAKNSRTKIGHGIGLSLSRKIIELHKGVMDIESQENVGTTITLQFPQSSNSIA